MGRRTVVAVAGWFAAATTATLTGLAAVQLIGSGITDGTGTEVLTPAQAAGQLASAAPLDTASGPPAATSPAATSTAATSPAATSPAGTSPAATPPAASSVAPTRPIGHAQPLSGPGGTVVAVCDGGLVTLLSWTPAQGFAVVRADRGPDNHAEVRFEGSGGRVEVRVECVAGKPVASWKTDD
jgi:hypothetical protein